MIHVEFSGTLGQCLQKLDDCPFIGLKHLDKKAHIVIDIEDMEEKKDESRKKRHNQILP